MHDIVINAVSRLQRLVDAHEQFKMTMGEADKEFNAIMALIQEVHRICQQYGISIGYENPYSYITGQVRFNYSPADQLKIRKCDETNKPRRHTIEMYASAAKPAFTSLLNSTFLGFNFVIHFTLTMSTS